MKFQVLTLAALATTAVTASHHQPNLRSLQTAFDANGQICAQAGERSKACPGVNLEGDRPEICCDGLTCVGARCQDTGAGTCANSGEKALECGINQTNRPEKCCETEEGVQLVCNADKVCVDPADLVAVVEEPASTSGGGGMSDELASALGMGGDVEDDKEEDEPMVEEPMVEELMVEEPMPEPTKPTVTITNDGSCGLDGVKSVTCGATAKEGRPSGCCESAPFCHPVEPMCTSTHPKLAVFGAEGDKVENCGADAKEGRPLLCAEGLFCDREYGVCTSVANGDTSFCGEAGDKSMDCGVGSEDTKVRPQSCCPGMYCGADKRCAPLSDNKELVPDLPEPEGVTVTSDGGDGEEEVAVAAEPVEWTHPSIETCGEDGDKVVNCGATFKEGRSFLCCEGLYCDSESSDPVCTPAAIGNTAFCAENGDKAMDCGVKFDPEKDRAQTCCEGLYCGPDRRCIPLAEFPEFVDLAAGSGVVTMTDGSKDKGGKVGEGPEDTTSSASGLVGSGIAAIVGGIVIALM